MMGKKLIPLYVLIFAAVLATGLIFGFVFRKSGGSTTPPNAPPPPAAQTSDNVLDVFASNATKERMQYLMGLAEKAAKQAPFLTVSKGCAVDPVVLLVPKPGDIFTVRNTDTVAHTLLFPSNNKVTVAAGGQQQITVKNFVPKDIGYMGYKCDESVNPEHVGMLYVPDPASSQ